ncbi:hypothetical protein [Streptomyces sp. NPDC057557]|uniref:hypothetical protein n=1 Tax=Streptomyces sp. NPDC057557 TaxID=3346167 RepID=UPI0036B4AD20
MTSAQNYPALPDHQLAKLGMICDESPNEWAHAPAHSRPAPATSTARRPRRRQH